MSEYISTIRFGKYDPSSLKGYEAAGGLQALRKALRMEPEQIISWIEKSGLRGRGGAGFPTYVKQQTASQYCPVCTRYVVCNADEGEPGTFKDRYIMENDPFALIEGMIISGYAIKAERGFIYLRGEYQRSIELIQNAIEEMRRAGYLGEHIYGSTFSFDVEIYLGAGSYLCGEEFTLIESLEGKRGYPRIKPPFPAQKGLWGMPTLVNNVETFVHIPYIIIEGPEKYASIGTVESRGTKLFCVSGRVKRPGCYELPFGVTLRQLVFDMAGGMQDGYVFKGALIGGAAGTFVDSTMLDVPLAYETLRKYDAVLGSGAVMVLDQTVKMKDFLSCILEFFHHESCGKCIPCRVGTYLLVEQIKQPNLTEQDLQWMLDQSEHMAKYSLCPLGQSPVLPIKSIIRYFQNDVL